MEIKKGNRFVCVEDVVMEGAEEVAHIKGNVYTSEKHGCITDELGNKSRFWWDSGEGKYFIPYSKLDKVYTEYTDRLYKMYLDYNSYKKEVIIKNVDCVFFDNMNMDGETGVFGWSSGDNFALDYGAVYLSEQAFIEFMGLTETDKKSDAVNNPSHYNNGSIEPIDYITANSMNFLEGNVVKYVTRYKFKNGLEDLKKAEFYLKNLIEGHGKD